MIMALRSLSSVVRREGLIDISVLLELYTQTFLSLGAHLAGFVFLNHLWVPSWCAF